LPTRAAPLMVGHKYPAEPFQVLTDFIYEALSELARGENIMAEFISRNDTAAIWQESKTKLETFCNQLSSEFAERVVSEPLEQWQPDWEKRVTERMEKIEAETLAAINAASFPVGDWKDA